ncbi:hypothetical protein DL546_002685 [Coniochaeta pulveracea]|uniref:Zn(2)-C6 fungal-type domain-containing protein n=1 Tax=Coniochaeta pulveracea TaxID=177199 RepID=A0A420Y529_9PEZI|nr:hypothetical protein DL546_002685 [Coniochaeta pulveracea]
MVGINHGTPAPYGRSCQNCARSKCKCIYPTGGTCCERCTRLKKECTPSRSVRTRNIRRPAASKTDKLEQKLDTLVSLIRNQTQAHSSPENELSPLNLFARLAAPSSHESQTSCASEVNEPQEAPSLTPISTLICIPEVPATEQDAEYQLRLFRESFLACFPCVYISNNLSAAQLRGERPFLWFTIMLVTCQSTNAQFRIGVTWRSIISQKMVVENEKTMDLLQGLLVFLGWSHYNKKDKPYLGVFSNLAKSLVYDMALNKIPGDPTVFACFKPWTATMKPKERTIEERRTVLACFYIMAQVAFTIRRMEGMRWTSYLEECLSALGENPECFGDEMLVAMVRAQVIIDHIGLEATPSSPVIQSSYLLSAMLAHLKTLKTQLPQTLEGNVMIQLQLHYTELVILENGLMHNPYIPEKHNFRRYEILSQIVEHVRAWFDIFFKSIPEFYLGFSFAHWCQLAQSLMALYKLSSLNEPSWDRAALRRDIDLFGVCDQLLAATEQAGLRRQAAGSQPNGQRSRFEEDMFITISRMLTNVKNTWAQELNGGKTSETEAVRLPVENSMANQQFTDTVPMQTSFNFLDDAWLAEIFNTSWE